EPKARISYGRKQPYAAYLDPTALGKSKVVKQNPAPPLADQPQHTFFRHNAETADPASVVWDNPITISSLKPLHTLDTFLWLQHADRPLISPMELLNVSMFKPHELTQQFITP